MVTEVPAYVAQLESGTCPQHTFLLFWRQICTSTLCFDFYLVRAGESSSLLFAGFQFTD